jgi:VIT1/CCC1 family predicted Fe2+/Mn2+ transporter
MTDTPSRSQPEPARRWSPRAIAETLATVLIAAGVIMLMQPFFLVLYTYSFVVTLAGTVLFVVGSKFPD